MSLTTLEQLQKYTTDASPSWNGYNHQGKVGIFVVLKMINELNLDYDSCGPYKLELEWLEDFSILQNDKYIALHQVKTYKESMPSKYKDAIWLLLAKSLDIPQVKNTYLHTTVPLSKTESLHQNLLTYKMTEKNEPEEEIQVEKKTKLKIYWTPKECHDYVKRSGRYDEVFGKFAIYTYEEDYQYCSMEDIEPKIKTQLGKIYKGFKTEQHLNRTYLHLLGLLDRNIRERHRDIQIGKKEQKASVSFQEIFEVIHRNYELPSREFCIYKLRHEFNLITNQFIEDLDDETEYSPNKDNLHSLINAVLELDDESFLKFCMKITPHHPINEDDPETLLEALRYYIPETHMKEGYLEILIQIQNKIDSVKHMFLKKGDDLKNISYLPTTIIESNKKATVGRMVEKILQNASLVEESLHEVDVMITKSINLPMLKPEKFNLDIPEVEEQFNEAFHKSETREKDYHDRIVKIKKIRMIDLTRAKEELNK
ncbi:ABC-three component system protein [Mesobacillus jeotgali]|uniref:ABC-three component systems C-terminal domain-containing protein n=1 Tax=Mesobacillus jeotgali TaxID=129985 RepID=A0ABY9VHV2_9BACI|nr:ABC-three component system protein [Mesobacillus jeotgali]WNF23153.1 hypothetical protein RH061_01100 [Mesobacillus jeotgali]